LIYYATIARKNSVQNARGFFLFVIFTEIVQRKRAIIVGVKRAKMRECGNYAQMLLLRILRGADKETESIAGNFIIPRRGEKAQGDAI